MVMLDWLPLEVRSLLSYMTSLSGRRTHKIMRLLISPCRILLIILRHAHHLRYRHSIDLAERLYQINVS